MLVRTLRRRVSSFLLRARISECVIQIIHPGYSELEGMFHVALELAYPFLKQAGRSTRVEFQFALVYVARFGSGPVERRVNFSGARAPQDTLDIDAANSSARHDHNAVLSPPQ